MKLTGLLPAIAIAGFAATAVAGEMPTIDATKYGYKEFRMGILGGENAQDRQKTYECFIPLISKMLGVPAKIFVAKDYAGTMEGLLGKTLDYAWLGPSGYAGVYLRDPKAVKPIMTRRQPSGALGYHSVLVSRADSGISKMEQLKGKVLGYADPNSTSGYLIPSVEWPQMGVDPENYFGRTVFSGGHENNVLAVLNGDVDAGVTWTSGVGEWSEGYSSGNLRKMVDKGILNMDDLTLIWKSNLIPNGPVVVQKDMPQEMVDAIFAGYRWVHENELECMEGVVGGEIKEWVRIDHSHYETIVAARKAKIEAKKKQGS
ncbi:MAG: phosphonate ABC transporter substrate-binding protein [Alphaproteobacteria bacterium]|jgi:phosphonate transport system substrate-binding protein|nr:phosphonate ABC transporter substrate-binding protein [Alphaproteobacteria bacterium]